ncbi:peptide deformylase 1A, chloroplastic-like isoform X1 [Phragmites australis]|uniref:peptide deformylase 1A, chloroplastic-like isoform X1 n=1 Tax=Phragmites australis TaxID=29695 RepID=UPI002D78327B|nr:peptide deformylase 1A, chloroplastic-like isoform X1 [Phragmites australis]XP_062212966.1 peptide deformylase 1A, chloroplastic-like isoform X1 [Phragmites australis]XP_062212974.1 peptide deformylase 1A, chloroplastic-like isoform X1 [Phragmites australis]XP_062212982.1 peptide deformylase 1A, chloroplastic-like isoform X1 [Phragmites australis]
MVALLRPLSSAAATTLLLAPATPLTGSAVAASAIIGRRWRSVRTNAGGGNWLSGLLGGKGGGAPTAITVTPGTVKAGDPVLHEPAQEVAPGDVPSEKVQGVIDRMIDVMRKAPGVGLAAPQIGVPLRVRATNNTAIIVLEDTQEYIGYAPKKDIEAQDRRPFDLLVIINPKLKKTSKRTAFFFEGCLSVDGYRAVVERHLDVEVSGLDRNGSPIKIQTSGWQARILQHECDHLEGTLYVDKMVPRTFRIVDNLDLPLPIGCPPLGAR